MDASGDAPPPPLADTPSRRDQVRRSRLRSRELEQMREVLAALDDSGYVAAGEEVVEIRQEVRDSVNGTRVADLRTDLCAWPGSDGPGSGAGGAPTPTSVIEDTTVAAAITLTTRHERVAVLNFASATTPGGSWSAGAKAQEEDLVRATTLLECLERAGSDFFEAHRKVGPPTYADVCMHSPGVLILRGSDRQLLAHPVSISVLTCAAPRADLLAEDQRDRLSEVLVRRLDLVLRAARAAGDRALVLGAWGCGAYGNDPAQVAGAFATLLDGPFRGSFDEIVFAITDRTPSGATRAPFTERFGR